VSRRIAPLLGGTVVYLVMVGRLDVPSLLQGLAASAAALALARAGGDGPAHRGSPWPLLRALPDLAVRQVAAGSWKVALAAAGLRPQPEPARVEVPLPGRPRVSPAALAVLETLSPGTFLIDLDEERGVMVFHLFDAADAPGLRRRHAELLALEEAGPDGEGPR
jgi:multicomponent Na+:H+ antiporter subunit E